jgi:hypothetical protein
VAEVVGSYELKEVYVDMIESGLNEKISAKKPRSMIELRADGSAVLRSFPIIQATGDGFDYAFQAFEDIEARWLIEPAGSVSSGRGEPTTVYGITFSHEPMKAQRWATFTGGKEVTGMIFTFYDGDQGQILGFTKQQKNPAR